MYGDEEKVGVDQINKLLAENDNETDSVSVQDLSPLALRAIHFG